MSSTANIMRRMPSVFAGTFGSRRRVELRQLEPPVAVRSPHHCDVDSDIVEADNAVHPTSLDCRLALQLQTEFKEERKSSLQVVDNDADVVHPLDRHTPQKLVLQPVRRS